MANLKDSSKRVHVCPSYIYIYIHLDLQMSKPFCTYVPKWAILERKSQFKHFVDPRAFFADTRSQRQFSFKIMGH